MCDLAMDHKIVLYMLRFFSTRQLQLQSSDAVTELLTDGFSTIISNKQQNGSYNLYTATSSGEVIDLTLLCTGISSTGTVQDVDVGDVIVILVIVFVIVLPLLALLCWRLGYLPCPWWGSSNKKLQRPLPALHRPLLEYMGDLSDSSAIAENTHSNDVKPMPAFIHLQEMQEIGSPGSSMKKPNTYLKRMIELWDQPIPLLVCASKAKRPDFAIIMILMTGPIPSNSRPSNCFWYLWNGMERHIQWRCSCYQGENAALYFAPFF
jgi:hypothetical protein